MTHDEQEWWQRDRRPLGRTMICQNCIYWDVGLFYVAELKKENKDDKSPWSGSDIFAECRRHAPTPTELLILHIGQMTAQAAWALNKIAKIEIDEQDDYEFGSTYENQVHEWPMTHATDWCGEFKKRD